MINRKQPELNRDSWLDILRGLAIFAVVAVHSSQYTDRILDSHNLLKMSTLSGIFSLGRYGVELFFFISGWLLSSIYGINSQKSMQKYWAKRIARIYPLWILFLIFEMAFSKFFHSGNWYFLTNDLSNKYSEINRPLVIILLTATFTLWISGSLWNSIISGGWSIQAEVAHYMIFPIQRKFRLVRAIYFSAFVNILSIFLFYLSKSANFENSPKYFSLSVEAWLRLNIFATYGYFLIGACAAIVFRNYSQTGDFRKSITLLGVPYLALLFFFLSFISIPLNFGNQTHAIGFLMVMLLLSKPLEQRKYLRIFFSYIGKYSYFIYFSHYVILRLIFRFIDNSNLVESLPFAQLSTLLIFFVTTILASSFFGRLSFLFFEYPIMQFARK